ncbi:MmpS family transport accessory protein [Pedobacter sp.]|uniref:MmpS family transport accessory protein n=1 Tax=Pedobacter sp. TaxID=1411316 RepID=UPI0031DC16F3
MKLKLQMVIALFIIILLSACSKKSETKDVSNSRKVKYEITGTFTGKLTIVYNDNVSGNTTVSNVGLPWSKEIEYNSNVLAIGVGAQASVMGNQGQTAVLKIYSNGAAVKTSTATAGSAGEILIPTIAYGF